MAPKDAWDSNSSSHFQGGLSYPCHNTRSATREGRPVLFGPATESGQDEIGDSGSRKHDGKLFPEDDVTVPVVTQQNKRAAESEAAAEEDGQEMAAKAASASLTSLTQRVLSVRSRRSCGKKQVLAEIFGLPVQQQS